MGKSFQHLKVALIASLVAVPAGSILAGPVLAVGAALLGRVPLLDGLAAAVAVVIPTILVAGGVAVVYGAPAYALLAWRGWATYFSTALVGAVPAIGALHEGWEPAAVVATYGLSISCLAHKFASLGRQRLGHSANNSSKPTPLRGAA